MHCIIHAVIQKAVLVNVNGICELRIRYFKIENLLKSMNGLPVLCIDKFRLVRLSQRHRTKVNRKSKKEFVSLASN